jgi:DNA uptake protein ComE-like DNA-binding protein
LGGFVDTAQYKEVWGLVPEQIVILKTYGIIEADEKPRSIYINRATASELRQHPYLNFKQVRILLNYREQHGPYRTWAELLASKALTESELNKLRPYISLEY